MKIKLFFSIVLGALLIFSFAIKAEAEMVPTFYDPPDRKVSMNIAMPIAVERTYLDVALSEQLQDHIYAEWVAQDAEEYFEFNDFLSIIVALIQWESGFDETNSNGKCHGLMSVSTLNEETMADWGIEDLLDPYDNITAGVHCFLNACKWTLENYGNEQLIEIALLRYNLGDRGAEEYLKNNNVYDKTYIQKVMCSVNKYIGELNG